MNLSVLDIFKVGVGPSSSHTMGPMNAACAFVHDLDSRSLLGRVDKVAAQVYGSLAPPIARYCSGSKATSLPRSIRPRWSPRSSASAVPAAS